MFRIILSTLITVLFPIESFCFWDVDGRFSLKIVSACNLNVGKDTSVSAIYYLYCVMFNYQVPR